MAATCTVQLRYGGQSIACDVTERPGSHLRIDVHPDLRVVAFVPPGRSPEEIQERLRGKARWIVRRLAEFERYHPLPVPKRYRSGESVFYLGRQYRLKVLSRREEHVKLRAGRLEIRTPHHGDRARLAALVQGWYKDRAQAYFTRRVEAVRPMLTWLGDEPVRLQVRAMSARWGSCSAAGLISLNPELMKAPSPCIDYVMVHELCHLKVHGHGPAFCRLLDRAMPDWRIRRVRLNAFGAQVMQT